jgi:hypothetical protein
MIFVTWFLWLLSTEVLTFSGLLERHWPDEVGWGWSLILVTIAITATVIRKPLAFQVGLSLTWAAFFFPASATHMIAPIGSTVMRFVFFFGGFLFLDHFETTMVDAGRGFDIAQDERTRIVVAYHRLAAQYVTQLGWVLIIPAWPIVFVLLLVLAINKYSPHRGERRKYEPDVEETPDDLQEEYVQPPPPELSDADVLFAPTL